MSYSTAVAMMCGVIMNEPSPTTAIAGNSGAANFAPRMPQVAKPIEAKPHDWSRCLGFCAFHSCTIQLWCTPTSVATSALPGMTFAIPVMKRSGRSGSCSDTMNGDW